MVQNLELTQISAQNLLRIYVEAVRSDYISSDLDWLNENGWELPFAHPDHKELTKAQVLVLTSTEEKIARRGLWRHLNVVYQGALGNSDKTGSAIAITNEIYSIDDCREETIGRLDILSRVYNYDEDSWDIEQAKGDQEIMRNMAEIMFAKCVEQTGDWANKRAILREEKIKRIEKRLRKRPAENIDARLRRDKERLKARRWWLNDQLVSLVPDINRMVAHPGLVKTAEEILS